MLHASIKSHLTLIFRFEWLGIKLSILFFVFSFDHNFQQIAPNEECELTFNIYVSKDFQPLEIRSKSNHQKFITIC
jgi:hypothetical protein